MATLIETSRLAAVRAPASAGAWGKLGQVFHAVDFFAEASVCYAKAAELDARAPRWPHLLGLLQLQEQPDAAISNLTRAVALTGVQPDAPIVQLSRALIERGRFDEATKHLQLLLGASPDHPAARLEMARVYLARNELTRAGESLVACATNSHTARPALLLLAQIRQRMGDTERAAQVSRRAASMSRPFDWPDPWLREAVVLRMDRQKLADQANGMLMQQRLPEAGAALNRLLNLFPEDAEGLLLLGRLRALEQRQPEAEEAFRRHLVAQPASLNGMIQLGICLLRQQRWNDAAGVLRQAITLKPDFAQAHSNLGYALAEAGDVAGAIVSYQNALRNAPGDPSTHLALAEQLHKAGRATEAIVHARRAEELDPQDPRARTLIEQIEKR